MTLSTRLIILVTFACLSSPLAWSKPKYISSKPLHELVNQRVGNVKSGGTVQLPIITWGGDIATIYGNGNSTTTSNGSIFAKQGLRFKLKREDVFSKQLEAYIRGDSPYLRGTLGMINMAAQLLDKNSRIKPVVFYQLTWSAGGDAMVVKKNIRKPKDLKGKTIALQAYGPHVDYLTKVLTDSGLKLSDVKLAWLPDLTGTDNTPMAAFYESGVDAAMVIIPDALALTSGGNVGTGSEDSVKGARILLSTKTANRIIADVYAVRSDYLRSNRANVQKFVKGLFQAQEKLSKLVKNKSSQASQYKKTFSTAAKLLLDSPQALADTEGLYADAEFVGFNGNVKFFANSSYPRRFSKLQKEIQTPFKSIGLLNRAVKISTAGWKYAQLERGLSNTSQVEAPRFDQSQVATVVSRKQKQGALQEGELFSFEIFFKPNQKSFSSDLYADSFKKVIDLASTYGGAIITVEGHSDPMGYLRNKKKGASGIVLRRIKQSAKNLSLSRSISVRESIINFAKNKGVNMDLSQFAVVGHGINQPKNGICGGDPCAPKSEQQWRDNMRVVFRIIQVEAEASTFKPL